MHGRVISVGTAEVCAQLHQVLIRIRVWNGLLTHIANAILIQIHLKYIELAEFETAEQKPISEKRGGMARNVHRALWDRKEASEFVRVMVLL